MAFDFPSSPTTGQTYSISGGPTYVYNGTAWQVLTPGNQFNRTVFTATAGQTTFTMTYVVGAIDVYRNGVKLVNTSDFTATNGTSIVLLNAATVGDTIEVISYPMITYSDAVKRTGDTMTGALAVPSLSSSGAISTSSLTVNSVPVLAGPAFSAYASTPTNTATTTWTKVVLNAEEFDTDNSFSTSTYRFQPTVAGYYQVSAAIYNASASNGQLCAIYTNGGVHKYGTQSAAPTTMYNSNVSALVYMNGSTDYVELYWFQSSGVTVNSLTGLAATYMQGILVRAA